MINTGCFFLFPFFSFLFFKLWFLLSPSLHLEWYVLTPFTGMGTVWAPPTIVGKQGGANNWCLVCSLFHTLGVLQYPGLRHCHCQYTRLVTRWQFMILPRPIMSVLVCLNNHPSNGSDWIGSLEELVGLSWCSIASFTLIYNTYSFSTFADLFRSIICNFCYLLKHHSKASFASVWI